MRRLALAFLIACSGGSSTNAAGDGPSNDNHDGTRDSSTEGATSMYVNGSRLVWRVLSTGDGLQAYYGGLYDKELATPCSPYTTATDGQRRCIPFETAYAGYYADASCTTKLAYASCTSGAPRFAI